TTAQIQVNRAERGEHAKVGAALGAAFVDDPVFQWLIPVDSANRDKRLAMFFTSMARSYLRRDKYVYCAGEGAGGALWSAPGSWLRRRSSCSARDRRYGGCGESRPADGQLCRRRRSCHAAAYSITAVPAASATAPIP